jgi:hypothetical protein
VRFGACISAGWAASSGKAAWLQTSLHERPLPSREGADLQEHGGGEADGEQRMQCPEPRGLLMRADQLGHVRRRVEGACGLEDDTELRAVGVEGRDAVRGGLLAALMPLVFIAVTQQIAMQLFDVVLGRRDVRPGREDRLHDLGLAGHFLLVVRAEGRDLQVGLQALDLAVLQPTHLDPGRRADALDGAECPPSALEFVDLGDEDEHLGGNLKRCGLDHSPFLHPSIPVSQATKTPAYTHFSPFRR